MTSTAILFAAALVFALLSAADKDRVPLWIAVVCLAIGLLTRQL